MTNKPDFIARTPKSIDGDKTVWTRVGAAWKNRTEGYTIELDCLPLNGKIVLLPPKEEADAEKSEVKSKTA